MKPENRFRGYGPKLENRQLKKLKLADVVDWAAGGYWKRIVPLLNILRKHGVDNLDFLQNIPDKELATLKGVGPKTVYVMRKGVELFLEGHTDRNPEGGVRFRELEKGFMATANNQESCRLLYLKEGPSNSMLNVSDFGPADVDQIILVNEKGGVCKVTVQIGLSEEGGKPAIGFVIHGPDGSYVVNPLEIVFDRNWPRALS